MCRLHDDGYFPIIFMRRDREYPEKPVCLSEDEYESMSNKAFYSVCSVYFFLIVCFTALSLQGFGIELIKLSDSLSWAICLICIAVLIYGPVNLIKYIRGRSYQKMQDPALNPKGCAWQGKVLDKEDPHYLLHVKYYQKHNTWQMPDDWNGE